MRLIHSYFPDYTDRLFEYGIAQKGDGFKINQHYKTPEDKKFNEIAKEGGAFYSLVKENASCIYVDRLQGGTFYSEYKFSKELIDLYKSIHVDFLGIQLHELGGTRALDWHRIQKCLKAENLSWTEENIYESVKRISSDKDYPHFSQGPASEYAALTMPKTVTEFVADMDYVIRQRQKTTYGNVLKCDNSCMHCRSEDDCGVRVAFVEVGGQGAQCRLQFALRRGLSRKSGKKWGTYIEPWGGKETTAYRFTRDGSNDWYFRKYSDVQDKFPDLYRAEGENGGTSISLAGRLMFYALFAGSDYFSEEWGAANTFYDWKEGGLTPYGVCKKKMADLSRKLTNIKADIPIAIILPKEYQLVLTHGGRLAFENDAVEGDYGDIVRRIHRLFYGESVLGLEDKILTTGRYGSLFDIIYEDTYENPGEEYQFLVDFSGRFSGKHFNSVDAFREEELYEKLDAFVTDYLPFTYEASGKIDYTLFSNDDDRYCCIFNHNGVSKSLEEGETVNPQATVQVSITMKDTELLEVLNLCGTDYSTFQHSRIEMVLPGGTFLLFQYG